MLSITGIIRSFQTNKTGRKNPRPIVTYTYSKVIFVFGCIALLLILLLIGIANSHRMIKSEQMRVAMLERLVIGIGDNNTVNLVTATIDNQICSVHRYPLESGVTDLPDSLPVTDQTRIHYPWAVAVSQGKLFIFDLRSIVAENAPCQAVCNNQKLYIAYVDGETASLATVEFSDDTPQLQIEKGFPKQIAEFKYKFTVTSDGISYLHVRREGDGQNQIQWLIDNGMTTKNVPYIFTGSGRLYAAAFTGLMMKEQSEFIKILPWSRLRDVAWDATIEPSVQFLNDQYLCFTCSTELPVFRTRSYYLVVDTKNCSWCTIDHNDRWRDLYDNLYN